MFKQRCQVAIIGGGSAGISCALALRKLGVTDVTVIESSHYDLFRIGESIPPEVKPLFIKLEIWSDFLKLQQQPCYGSRSWWGDDRRGHNDSVLNPRGHGWHLDRVRFNRFLAAQAQVKGIKLFTGCYFERTESDDGRQHQLQFNHNSTATILISDFVIDASGSKGCFAKAMGSEKRFSDPLICSAGRFLIDGDNHPLTGLTHLEATETGWWYAARLPGQQILISHTTDNQTFRNLKLKQSIHWNQQLAQAPNTHMLHENLRPLDPQPSIYVAPSFVLNKMVGQSWLAVGDSASSFDPITSQGILKSISDGIQAAQCVAQTLFQHKTKFLDDYQAQIRLRHQQYRQMRDHFYRLETRFADTPFWMKMQKGLDKQHSNTRETNGVSSELVNQQS